MEMKTEAELKALLSKIRISKDFKRHFDKAPEYGYAVTQVRLYRNLQATFERYQLNDDEVKLIMFKLMETIKLVCKEKDEVIL